jgi:hypothetical protein
MSEGFFSRGFRGRRQKSELSGRLPPGQYLERGFPVLSAGPTPHTPLANWDFSIVGEVDQHPLMFICGPTPFVETAAAILVELGHEPGRVKTERFGPTGEA